MGWQIRAFGIYWQWPKVYNNRETQEGSQRRFAVAENVKQTRKMVGILLAVNSGVTRGKETTTQPDPGKEHPASKDINVPTARK